MGHLVSSDAFAANHASLAADLADLRAAPRYTLLIRAAKLVSRQGEYLCVIRDVSETGISVRIFHALPASAKMAIELQNGDRNMVELVWQNEERAGFRFTERADIARIIEGPSAFGRRPIRINLAAPAVVEALGSPTDATIQDISQQGAKVACAASFAIDQRVKLCAHGMRDIPAKVRWRKEGTWGLVFEETFQFGELARVVRHLQDRS